ncbi:protein lethal(2)essential for life-like [Aedes albopictus]|uniref:SHSP domain-containing protein n=1 Tax=Aedes albopictus TaxID=7160 RepID=A0ABM1YPR0_AEDAL|nr:protein lethal(2)essential for life-like [Aedes albopictus]
MVLIPTILFSDMWDGRMDSPLRSSQVPFKQFGRDPFSGGILVTFDNSPESCDRKPCCRRPSQQRKNEEMKPKVAEKPAEDFQISLDVQDFLPEDISVKATKQFVIVEAKHEDKDAEHGYVFNHFVRRYQLPEGHDNERLESTLSSDGVLTIRAPVLALPEPDKERTVVINQEKASIPSEKSEESKEKENFTLEDLDE